MLNSLEITDNELSYLEEVIYCLIREGSNENMDMLCDIHTKIKSLMQQPRVERVSGIMNEEWINLARKNGFLK